MPMPPLSRIWVWGYFFPALAINYGAPDTGGWNQGHRWGNTVGGGAEMAGEYEWISKSTGTRPACSTVRPGATTNFPPYLQPTGQCTQIKTGAVADSVYVGIVRRDFEGATFLHNIGWNITQNDTALEYMGRYSAPIVFADAQYGFPASTFYPMSVAGITDNSVCDYRGKPVVAGTVDGADYRTADGGCSAIRLRAAEAAVLMRAPVR
jgi:hypothetical protein